MSPDTPDTPPKIPILHHALGIIVGGFVRTFRILPAPIGYAIADVAGIGLMAWTAVFQPPRKGKPRSSGFYRNYDIVYRDKGNTAHRRRIMFAWARHVCRMSIDFCRLPTITADNVEAYIDTTDYGILREVIQGGKGLIGATGHIGNFELGGFAAPLVGVPTAAIFNDSPIQPVTDLISKIRSTRGMRVIKKAGATRDMIRCLKDGMNVGFAVDVMTKHNGVFAPFLGTLAATNKTAALLHLKTGAPIVVHSTKRIGTFRFKFHVWDVVEHTKTDDKEADALAIMTRVNNALSRAILDCPEQWFWQSRRFRYRPPGEEPLPNKLPPLVEDSVHAGTITQP